MIDLYFAAPSLAAFQADMGAFTADNGWPNVAVSADIPSFTGSSRIDFIIIPNLVAIPAVVGVNGNIVTAAVTRGWHCNARLSEGRPNAPTGAFVQVGMMAAAWFLDHPVVLHNSPPSVLLRYGVEARLVHRAPNGSVMFDTAPVHPKAGWA